MSEEKMQDALPITPSIESLKLAHEVCRLHNCASDVETLIRMAASFDAYLSLGLACLPNDVPSLIEKCDNPFFFNKFDVGFFEIRGSTLFFCQKQEKHSPDQVFFGHASHQKSPNGRSNKPTSDSSSEAGTETVAHSTHNQKENRI